MARLTERIERGEETLDYSEAHGWLPALLSALDVSPESQVLVFSKTSLQLRKISPKKPRAIYFNDDVYVGWCQQGDVLEVAATDKDLGAVFYTLDQDDSETPKISRDRGQCLSCHATRRTQDVPGFLVRSIYPDFNGRPRTGTRTYVTDQNTDFENRYGGWYVLGEHGDMRHMGNLIARDRLDPESLDRDAGANLRNLDGLCDTSPYLNGKSDLVALMILEHQSQMHNLIARANIETRIATYYDEGINKALERPKGTQSESTQRRIAKACEKLVRLMLFADEVPLPSPVRGNSAYMEQFASKEHFRAHYDSRGRSLRQLDLQSRLFRYPCSFLIYSEAFDALPHAMSEAVQGRLKEVLLAETPVDGFERLSQEDRQAIYEILKETKPGYLD